MENRFRERFFHKVWWFGPSGRLYPLFQINQIFMIFVCFRIEYLHPFPENVFQFHNIFWFFKNNPNYSTGFSKSEILLSLSNIMHTVIFLQRQIFLDGPCIKMRIPQWSCFVAVSNGRRWYRRIKIFGVTTVLVNTLNHRIDILGTPPSLLRYMSTKSINCLNTSLNQDWECLSTYWLRKKWAWRRTDTNLSVWRRHFKSCIGGCIFPVNRMEKCDISQHCAIKIEYFIMSRREQTLLQLSSAKLRQVN